MKDISEILKQKEVELGRVRHEIESLRMVAMLLADDSDFDESEQKDLPSKEESAEKAAGIQTDLEPTGTDGLFSSITPPRSGVWSILKRPK